MISIPNRTILKKNDSLKNPPTYDNTFVLTNPPYLARNKSSDKSIFDLYNTNDLYKCFIASLINNPPNGGIMIIPLNFLCSIRVSDIKLREAFLSHFKLHRINIFEEQVFDDTTYTVCAIQFSKTSCMSSNDIIIDFYPSKQSIVATLNKNNNYMIGGEMYKLSDNPKYTITRLTKLNINDPHTNILAKCIDDNLSNQISLSIVGDDKKYIDNTTNLSSRTYATLSISPQLSLDRQKELVKRFNEYMREMRAKYHSLWLTNYRESKDMARKRISFSLVYKICGKILSDMDANDLESQLSNLHIT